MKVGFEAKRAFHNTRGLGNYSRLLIEGLEKYSSGDELLLYTPAIKKERFKNWSKSIKSKVVTPNGLWSKTSSLWRTFGISKDIKRDGVELFHGLSHELPRGIEFSGVKSIVTMHDLIFMRHPEFFSPIDRMTYKKKFSHACEVADMVIAICEQTKRDLIELLGVDEKKIRVHYQSCDPSFYQSVSDEQKRSLRKKYNIEGEFILTVGAIEPNKNQLSLLKAFNEIKERTPENLIIIGGESSYKKTLVQYINDHGLQGRVKIISGVPFDELPTFYQSAKLFSFLSFYEGFGIPVLEAYFSKCAVLASLSSSIPEAAGPDAYYVDPHNIESISKGLFELLSNDELRQRNATMGLSYVQQFRLEETTKKLKGLYEEALKLN